MPHRVNWFVYISKTECRAAWISRHVGCYGDPEANEFMRIANSDSFEVVKHSLSQKEAKKLAQDIRRGIAI